MVEMKAGRWDLSPRVSDRAIDFVVVLLPVGTSPFSAKPDDFRRVHVRAVNSLGARSAPDVLALMTKGFHVAEVAERGRESLEFAAARVRARAVAEAAEVPSDLRSANTAAPLVGPYIPPPRAG